MSKNSKELAVKYHGNGKLPKKTKKNPNVAEVSKMGYRDDSPYRSMPYIDIHTPNGTIDMSATGIPLWANGRVLPPYSGMHQFDSKVVREIPLAQTGISFRTGESFDSPAPTQLTPAQEIAYQRYKASLGEFGNDEDYDLRGYWKNEAMKGLSRSGIEGQHFTDKYKRVGDPFTGEYPLLSDESMYASQFDKRGQGYWTKIKDVPIDDKTVRTAKENGEMWQFRPSNKKGGIMKQFQSGGSKNKYDFNDLFLTDEEVEANLNELSDRRQRCVESGASGCLSNANAYYNIYIAPKLNAPSSWDELDNAKVISSKENTFDSWDIHALNNRNILFNKYNQKQKNLTPEKDWSKLNLPIGAIIGFGEHGPQFGGTPDKALNATKGLPLAGHSGRVVGYDRFTGEPFIFDTVNGLKRISQNGYHPISVISVDKRIANNTFDQINFGKISSKDLSFKGDFTDIDVKIPEEFGDPDELIPFINAIKNNKSKFANAIGMNNQEYNENARRAIALSISETAGGDDWTAPSKHIPLIGSMHVPFAYTLDQMGLTGSAGITQLNKDVLKNLMGDSATQRKFKKVFGDEFNYNKFSFSNPEHVAFATMLLLKQNERAAKRLNERASKKYNKTNNPNFTYDDLAWYMWNQPGTILKGEAQGDNANYKKYKKAFDMINVDQSLRSKLAHEKHGGSISKLPSHLPEAYQKGGWLNKYQGGGAYYDPAADRIFNLNNYPEGPERDAVEQHERYHQYQNRYDALRLPDDYSGPLRRPSAANLDNLKMNYYNRRQVEAQNIANQFLNMNPSFMFANPNYLYNSVIDPALYYTPWTAEGEAHDWENAFREGNVSEPLPENFQVENYQVGGNVAKLAKLMAKMAKKSNGKSSSQHLREMVKMKRSGVDMENFFENLGWTSGGKSLWNNMKRYGTRVLTGGQELGPDASAISAGKRKWTSKNLGLTGENVIVETNKAKYAHPNAVLIDDLPKNVKSFKDAGGKAILHKGNKKETLGHLKKMLNNNPDLEVYTDLDGVLVDLQGGVKKYNSLAKKGVRSRYNQFQVGGSTTPIGTVNLPTVEITADRFNRDDLNKFINKSINQANAPSFGRQSTATTIPNQVKSYMDFNGPVVQTWDPVARKFQLKSARLVAEEKAQREADMGTISPLKERSFFEKVDRGIADIQNFSLAPGDYGQKNPDRPLIEHIMNPISLAMYSIPKVGPALGAYQVTRKLLTNPGQYLPKNPDDPSSWASAGLMAALDFAALEGATGGIPKYNPLKPLNNLGLSASNLPEGLTMDMAKAIYETNSVGGVEEAIERELWNAGIIRRNEQVRANNPGGSPTVPKNIKDFITQNNLQADANHVVKELDKRGFAIDFNSPVFKDPDKLVEAFDKAKELLTGNSGKGRLMRAYLNGKKADKGISALRQEISKLRAIQTDPRIRLKYLEDVRQSGTSSHKPTSIKVKLDDPNLGYRIPIEVDFTASPVSTHNSNFIGTSHLTLTSKIKDPRDFGFGIGDTPYDNLSFMISKDGIASHMMFVAAPLPHGSQLTPELLSRWQKARQFNSGQLMTAAMDMMPIKTVVTEANMSLDSHKGLMSIGERPNYKYISASENEGLVRESPAHGEMHWQLQGADDVIIPLAEPNSMARFSPHTEDLANFRYPSNAKESLMAGIRTQNSVLESTNQMLKKQLENGHITQKFYDDNVTHWFVDPTDLSKGVTTKAPKMITSNNNPITADEFFRWNAAARKRYLPVKTSKHPFFANGADGYNPDFYRTIGEGTIKRIFTDEATAKRLSTNSKLYSSTAQYSNNQISVYGVAGDDDLLQKYMRTAPVGGAGNVKVLQPIPAFVKEYKKFGGEIGGRKLKKGGQNWLSKYK